MKRDKPGSSDMKEVRVEAKESRLSHHLRTQYAKHDKLPANPIDGREHAIVGVQLSLIETQKIEKPKREEMKGGRESRESKDRDGKEKTQTQPKLRQLEDLLRQEESALDYYESWHNVTTTIQVSEMLEPRGSSKFIQRILVVGPAGIGKTTLLHYIAHQWSLGNLWNERFQAVFWLPLRCLLKEDYRHARDLSVETLLHAECLEASTQKVISVKQLQAFLEQNKGRVALLLDGYDECALEVEEAKSPVGAVFQELLEMGTVFMTSRPYRLNQALVKKFDRHLENRGFSDAQIQKYISDYFHDKPSQAQQLSQLLSQQSRLKGMSHVPLILSILCGLYEEEFSVTESERHTSKEPKAKEAKETQSTQSRASLLTQTENLTGLYHQLTGYLVKRYLKERTQQDTRGVEEVELLMDFCQDELNFLSHLAFAGLTQREILLSPVLFKRLAMEYRVQPHLPDKALRLGFLQKAGEGHRGETYAPHYFIHLSFQEYFAARYLFESLKHPKSHPRYQQAMQFLSHQKYEPRYAMVFRFTAGLCSQDKTQDKAIQSFWKALLSPPLDILGMGHLCLMIRCLDETAGDERVPHRKELQDEIENAIQSLFTSATDENELECSMKKHLLNRLFLELSQTTTSGSVSGALSICLVTLKDRSKDVQKAAAEALGQLGAKAATEPLIQALVFTALKDKSEGVRNAAVETLGRLGEKAATEPVIHALLAALKKADWDDSRKAVAEALGNFVEKAATESMTQALLAALKEEYCHVRKASAQALGRLGEKTVTEPVIQALLTALIDKSVLVQIATAESLCCFGEKAAINLAQQVLVAALKNKSEYVRSAAAEALGLLGEKAATEPVIQALLAALKDKEWRGQNAAAKALAQVGEKAATESVIQGLLNVLKDENEFVRHAAAQVLGQLGKKAMTEFVIQALLTTLKDKDSYVRSAVAEALGLLGEKTATEPIIQALLATLKDESWDVQTAAKHALNWLYKSAATEPVIQALSAASKHKEWGWGIQCTAVYALGTLENKAAIEPAIQALLTALKDEEREVRIAAANALGQLGEKAATKPVIQALEAALKDDSPFGNKIRSAACRSLGLLGEKAATEPVIQALLAALEDGCDDVQRAATHALDCLGKSVTADPVIQGLLNALKDNKKYIKSYAAYAKQLEREQSETLTRLMYGLISENRVCRYDAAKAMVQLGEKAATEPVLQALLKTKFLHKAGSFPRPALLANYLQTHVPLLHRFKKSYAQIVTTLLLQSSCLLYDKTQQQLSLYDGQTHSYELTTGDHLKRVQALLQCPQTLAKTFGLPVRLTNPTLKDPYPVSDAPDLLMTRFSPLPLERRLSVLEAPLLKRVLKREKVKLQAEQQQEEIHFNPLLREYYHSFIQYLEEAWSASRVIHSKLVAHGKKTTADHVVAGVNVVGGALSVPGLSLITGALEKAVNAYTYRDKHHAVNCIAGFFTSSEESAAYIELLARILTLVFSEKIMEIAHPEKATILQKAERAARAVKNVVMVRDVNTPIKQLAEAHLEIILKAIIGKTLQPHPKPEDLPRFVELVQAHSKAESYNLEPLLTTTDAGRTLLEHTAEPATRSRSGAQSLGPSNPSASLLAASLSEAFGTSQEHKITAVSSASLSLTPDG